MKLLTQTTESNRQHCIGRDNASAAPRVSACAVLCRCCQYRLTVWCKRCLYGLLMRCVILSRNRRYHAFVVLGVVSRSASIPPVSNRGVIKRGFRLRSRIWDGVKEDKHEQIRRVWRAARVAMDMWLQSEGIVSVPHVMLDCVRLAYRPAWLCIMEYKPIETTTKYAKPFLVYVEDGVYVARVVTDEHGQID